MGSQKEKHKKSAILKVLNMRKKRKKLVSTYHGRCKLDIVVTISQHIQI